MTATVVTFPRTVDPVPLEADAFATWLEELADDGCVARADLMVLLELVAAAHRDWTELVHQLGTAAISTAATHTAAASLEGILEQLRRRLTDYVNRSTS